MPNRTCTIDGCDKPHHGRGWCKMHLARWERTGDPLGREGRQPRGCSIPGCDQPHDALGWCARHYTRWLRHGDPLVRKTADHGHAVHTGQSPEYIAWAHMRARCGNPGHKSWPNYGGRGITVHPAWAASFAAFLADVGPRPGPGWSLDRIDNDRGYEPGNVRWATQQQQVQNRRVARPPLAWRAGAWPPAEWERRLGLPKGIIRKRLDLGWPVERALTEPHRPRGGPHA